MAQKSQERQSVADVQTMIIQSLTFFGDKPNVMKTKRNKYVGMG